MLKCFLYLWGEEVQQKQETLLWGVLMHYEIRVNLVVIILCLDSIDSQRNNIERWYFKMLYLHVLYTCETLTLAPPYLHNGAGLILRSSSTPSWMTKRGACKWYNNSRETINHELNDTFSYQILVRLSKSLVCLDETIGVWSLVWWSQESCYKRLPQPRSHTLRHV
jgi:hypothetical protein